MMVYYCVGASTLSLVIVLVGVTWFCYRRCRQSHEAGDPEAEREPTVRLVRTTETLPQNATYADMNQAGAEQQVYEVASAPVRQEEARSSYSTPINNAPLLHHVASGSSEDTRRSAAPSCNRISVDNTRSADEEQLQGEVYYVLESCH